MRLSYCATILLTGIAFTSISANAMEPCVNPVSVHVSATGTGRMPIVVEPDLGFGEPVEVTWRGDADGDGTIDVILRFNECSGYGECIYALFLACPGLDRYGTVWGPDYALTFSPVGERDDPLRAERAGPTKAAKSPTSPFGIVFSHRLGYMAEENIEIRTVWYLGNGQWSGGERVIRPNR